MTGCVYPGHRNSRVIFQMMQAHVQPMRLDQSAPEPKAAPKLACHMTDLTGNGGIR